MNYLITGASSGIGFELCKILLEIPENKVIAVSRKVDSLKSLAVMHEGRILPLAFDLLQHDLKPITEAVSVFFESNLHVLVNNAGILISKPFMETEFNDYHFQMETNFGAPYRLIRCLVHFMPENSDIINISSMGGFQGSVKYPGLSLYSSSKAALACLSECLALELLQYGIRVNCLALGATNTEMLKSAFPDFKASVNAQEMAGFIARFAGHESRLFNGKIIPVAVSNP